MVHLNKSLFYWDKTSVFVCGHQINFSYFMVTRGMLLVPLAYNRLYHGVVSIYQKKKGKLEVSICFLFHLVKFRGLVWAVASQLLFNYSQFFD